MLISAQQTHEHPWISAHGVDVSAVSIHFSAGEAREGVGRVLKSQHLSMNVWDGLCRLTDRRPPHFSAHWSVG